MSMELRHLRYFLAVAESLSFTRAAVALNVSQPTLSQQIRQLEDGVGCALLDRVGRHVRLTAAGEVFREHAQRVLNEIDAAENALAELQGLMRGTLRIGVFQSFNSSLLPPILGAFSEACPDIRVVVRQLPTREMEAHLVRGDLDLGIAYVTPESSRIESEKLFDEAMTLVVSDTHRYARRREITAAQLADQPLVVLTRQFPSRLLVSQWFADAGIEPCIRIEIDSTDTILATVQRSNLATIQTRRMAAIFPRLRCIPLKPKLTRSVAILWCSGSERSAAARAIAAMIRKAYSQQRPQSG
jgi:LysR family cyn operon transcriptional activator